MSQRRRSTSERITPSIPTSHTTGRVLYGSLLIAVSLNLFGGERGNSPASIAPVLRVWLM